MGMTEKQMGALDRMCGHRTGDSYELSGYKVTMLELDRYQLNLPESTNASGNNSTVGIDKDTKLPINAQSILKQMYANWLIDINKKINN